MLLDAAPHGAPADRAAALNDQWRVQHLLTEMAAADPDRYVVVDADGSDDEVADRIRAALRGVFVGRLSGLAPHEEPGTMPVTLPMEAPEEPVVEAK